MSKQQRPPLSDPATQDGVMAPRSWRTIMANFAWLSGQRALDLAISLLVTVLVARYLGPERFGILGYLIGLAAIFGSLVPLGMDRIIVLELVRNPEDTNRLLGTSTALKLCSGVVIGTCMLVAVPTLSPGLEKALLFGLLFAATTIVCAFNAPELLFTAETNARYVVLSNSIGRVTMALVRLALIYVAATLPAFVTATALEPVLTIIVLLCFYQRHGRDLAEWKFDGTLVGTLVRRGFPLMLASLGTAILMRVGVVMVEQLAGEAAAGLYVGAVRIADTCGLVATNLIISISPTLISIRSQSPARYMEAIARLLQGVSVAMTAVAVALYMISDQLIGILLGPSFAGAAGVLRIYIWSTIFVGLGMVQVQWLINEGYERFVFFRALVGAAINLAANYLLIPRYGAEGAAYAAVAAQFAACVLMNLTYDARTREIFVLQIRALVGLNLGRLGAGWSVQKKS